jgi:phosphate transport system protein
MTLHFRREIDRLKKLILALGAIVEETVQKSVRSFEERNVPVAKSIIENDSLIDQKEVEVEEECLKILALHQPVAIDLRYVIAVLKINNDLERVGDLAVHIAERTLALAHTRINRHYINFDMMANMTRDMLKKSLDALINLDTRMAREICTMDDRIDEVHEQTFNKIEKLINENPQEAPVILHYLSVSRYLERIADLATNIAEDLVYLVEGRIARHDKKMLEV